MAQNTYVYFIKNLWFATESHTMPLKDKEYVSE